MIMNDYEGYSKGEICNRNGCKGIIDEHDKEGGCSCHINPPCSYCETSTAYCSKCDWDAQEEWYEKDAIDAEYYRNNPPKPYVYKSDAQLFDEMEEGKFNYIRVASGGYTISRVKGKHPNLSREEIERRLRIYENPHMPRFKYYDKRMFELTYFCD